MALINPLEILDAFSPLLTDSGGIKQIDCSQFSNLYSVMKDCSTKLISKCIYCNILMSTSSEVLEQFLKIGGWNLICLWVKTSRDAGNVSFLLELLKLLSILPMTIERLRENECPKLVKKLCKHENQEIALKANQIIKKWTKIIHALSEKGSGQNGNNPVNSSNNSNSNNNSKEKKRKSVEGGQTSAIDNSIVSKKVKTTNNTKSESVANNSGSSVNTSDAAGDSSSNINNSNSNDNSNVLSDSDPYETFSRDDINKFIVNQTKEPKHRPVTVKVKQGKFRLDLSTPSKPSGKVKKKSELKDVKTGDVKKVLSNKASNETFKLANQSVTKSTHQTSSTHVLKDSISFMDALSVMPVINKKRRKTNKELDNTTTNSHKVQIQENKQNISDNSCSPTAASALPGYSSNTNSNSLNVTTLDNNSSSVSKDVNNDSKDNCNDKITIDTPKSPPRFSFYKDILEEKSEDTKGSPNSDSQAGCVKADTANDDDKISVTVSENQIGDSSEQLEPLSTDIPKSNSTENIKSENESLSSDSGNSGVFKPKPILCYVKKGVKKSVRWPDDSQIEKVKFFELDENERINVTRPQADMKRFDMKHEAQLMQEAKKGRCFTYAPWKLIPIELDSQNVLVERGYNSRERETQAERMKTTLECFYIQNQIPDSPHEPDREFHTDSNEQVQIIPLEDENMTDKIQDTYAVTNTIQSPTDACTNVTNQFEYNNTASYNNDVKYNASSDSYTPFSNNNVPNNYQPPNSNVPYHGSTPNVPNSNFIPPTSNTFEANNQAPSTNYVYNSYSSTNVPPANQPPISYPINNPAPPNIYNDYPNNGNFGPPGPMGHQMPNQNSPPNMFNNNNPPVNFYNQGPPPPGNEQSNYNSYWSDNNGPPPSGNYPPPGGPPFPMPPPMQGAPGPRFRPRMPGGPPRPRGFHPRSGSEVCRFFSKFGKCKFENRCNYSHVLENQKPIRF